MLLVLALFGKVFKIPQFFLTNSCGYRFCLKGKNSFEKIMFL